MFIRGLNCWLRPLIAYAHRDGADLALHLRDRLTALGYDVSLDRQRRRGRDRRIVEIERALDRAAVVLALLSDGSFTSDTCRAVPTRVGKSRSSEAVRGKRY